MSFEQLKHGLDAWSVYVYHVLRARKQAWKVIQRDPRSAIMNQWVKWPLSSHMGIDRPEPFYRAWCRYTKPVHICSTTTCPRSKCIRWMQTDHECNEKCRPYLPHEKSYLPHRCNEACPRYAVGDYYVCELSGHAHHCTEDRCTRLITDSERRVCPWTGRAYDLEIDDEVIFDQNSENYIQPMKLKRAVSAPPPLFVTTTPVEAPVVLSLTPPPRIKSLAHAYLVMNRDPSLKPLVSITTTEQPEFMHMDQLLRLKNEKNQGKPPPKKRQRRISKQARLRDSDNAGQHKTLYCTIFSSILLDSKGVAIALPSDFVEYVVEIIDRLWKFVIRSPVYPTVTNRYKQNLHCLHLLYTMITGFNPNSEDEYIVPFVPTMRDVLPRQKAMTKMTRIRMRLLTETAKDFRKLVSACPEDVLEDFVKKLPEMPDSCRFFDPMNE